MDRETKLMQRAVIYLGMGGKPADLESAILSQQHRCEQRANELRAIVVGEYVDFGSGMGADRPKLQEMLADLKARQGNQAINFVIVYDHARIARDMHTYSRIAWEIEQAGAQLIVASVPLAEYVSAQKELPVQPVDQSLPEGDVLLALLRTAHQNLTPNQSLVVVATLPTGETIHGQVEAIGSQLSIRTTDGRLFEAVPTDCLEKVGVQQAHERRDI